MTTAHVDLVSHWQIPAPVDRVWAALVKPEAWPTWWSGVRSVRTLRPGDAGGPGAVHRIHWSTRLPCEVVIDVETVEALPNERLRERARGQHRGERIWLLRAAGDLTDVTCVWRVELTQPGMRWLAPVLAPWLRWNHAAVMRAGEVGLTRYLAGQALTPGLRA
jgi:uncharacterized protein YndB with AHSA1/START domain